MTTSRDLRAYIQERLKILTEAGNKTTANPNPWRHRAAELRLLLDRANAKRVCKTDAGVYMTPDEIAASKSIIGPEHYDRDESEPR